MHLADAFIQKGLNFLSVLAFPGNQTHNIAMASDMFYCLERLLYCLRTNVLVVLCQFVFICALRVS